jgi:FkbM family methyltransferase
MIELKSAKLFPALRNTRVYQRYSKWRKQIKRALKKKTAMKRTTRFYSQFIPYGSICFDIGANIGNRTEAFLSLGATVVAVEPQEECIKALQERFVGNNRLIVIPKGVDRQPGTKDLFMGTTSTLASMSSEWIERVSKAGRFGEHAWNSHATIQTTTLDELIRDHGKPSFCKIDVEGHEYSVRQGLSATVPAISFEFIPDYTEAAIECIDYLACLGMKSFNYSHGETLKFVLPRWIDAREMIKIMHKCQSSDHLGGDIYAMEYRK